MILSDSDVEKIRAKVGYKPKGYLDEISSRGLHVAAEVHPTLPYVLVPLTRGYSALVDMEDYARVSALKWQVHIEPDGRLYATAHVPGSGQGGKSVLMHRFVKGVTDPKIKIDHKDGEGLHNWRDNLRIANNRQNISNQKKHKDCKNQFKGVSRLPNGTWRASITVQYKKKYLGRFATEELAARAYDEAARRLHGEFAHCNFQKEVA